MLVADKSMEEGPFGKRQRIASWAIMTAVQLLFHIPLALLLYAIFTLDLNLFLILGLLTLLQLPVRRSQSYIDFVNKVVQPFKYFDKFEIIYEEPITKETRCIFGVHPHSVFGMSLLLLMNSAKEGPLSNIIGLGSRFILNFPLAGAVLKLWGVQAVNHKNLKQLMK